MNIPLILSSSDMTYAIMLSTVWWLHITLLGCW